MTRILTIIALLFAMPMLAGCSNVSIIEEVGMTFVENQQSFRWKIMGSFSRGTKFQLISLSDGRKAVWSGAVSGTALYVGYRNELGIVLDSKGCSTGEHLVRSMGVVNIGKDWRASNNPPKGICFR